MDLEHNKVSREEAASNLQVRINGVPWVAQRIAIVRKSGSRTQWVHMIIIDQKSGMQLEYFMERLSMIKAWMALDMGIMTKEHVADLIINVNKKRCIANDVLAFESGGESWIRMDLECVDGIKQTIAIERQGMIDAYYALRTSIEDMINDGIEAIGGLLNM